MITGLSRVTILVRDQDEALRFYTDVLGLEKRADVAFGPGMRWLTVAPRGQATPEIVLQQPNAAMHGEHNAQQMVEMIGHGTTWVFETEDCRATYAALRGRGVEFQSEPQEQPYGIEAVFVDLYGNSFSLLQPAGRPDEQPAQADAPGERPARSGNKKEILTELRANHAEMQATLAMLDSARMTEAGATGHWSVKNVLTHIASGSDWLADQIERATRGEPPDWAEIEREKAAGLFDNETRNTYDYEQFKDMSLPDVLEWWQRSFARLIAAVEAAPDAVLAAPDWWTGQGTLGQSIWSEHEGEHAQGIRAWATS